MKKMLLLIMFFILMVNFEVDAKTRTCNYKSSDDTIQVRITIENAEDYKKASFSGAINASSSYAFQLYDNYGSIEDTRSFKRKLTEVCPNNVYITCSDTYKYCDVGDQFIMSSNLALQVGYKMLTLSNANINSGNNKNNYTPNYSLGIFGGVTGNATCPAIFGSADDPDSIFGFMSKYIFNPIRWLTPIILIVLTSLDFAKAIFMDEKDGMGKAKGNFMKRAVAALIIFLAPTIVSILLTLIDGANVSECMKNAEIGNL